MFHWRPVFSFAEVSSARNTNLSAHPELVQVVRLDNEDAAAVLVAAVVGGGGQVVP